ncbi:hypothetical protein EON65_37860, partial [archaeon]
MRDSYIPTNSERQSLLHARLSPTSEAKRRVENEWTFLDGFSTYHSIINTTSSRPLTVIWDLLEVPVLLIIMGIASALVSYCTTQVTAYGTQMRWNIIDATSDHPNWLYYILWCVGFSLLACACTHSICKEACGSGLPEMKTILGGVVKPVLLSLRLVTAKIIGLSFAMIAGLSIGKEGPFVQISGALADQIMRLDIFAHIRKQDAKRLEMIACACASGVGATFGTAFGGVLFSIEFTSSAYLVKTLPKAFLTSVCAMLCIYTLESIWGGADQFTLFSSPPLPLSPIQPNIYELAGFVILGLFCALLGVMFVYIVETVSKWKNAFLDPNMGVSLSTITMRRYMLVGFVTLLISLGMYYEVCQMRGVVGGVVPPHSTP